MTAFSLILITESITYSGDGVHPTRVVLHENDIGTYVTWLEVMPRDQKAYKILGHYDIPSFLDGILDFHAREENLAREFKPMHN